MTSTVWPQPPRSSDQAVSLGRPLPASSLVIATKSNSSRPPIHPQICPSRANLTQLRLIQNKGREVAAAFRRPSRHRRNPAHLERLSGWFVRQGKTLHQSRHTSDEKITRALSTDRPSQPISRHLCRPSEPFSLPQGSRPSPRDRPVHESKHAEMLAIAPGLSVGRM